MLYGFSTGALAKGDFQRGLAICREYGLEAVELSALREPELHPLVNALDALDLGEFKAVSIHAPSSRTMDEGDLLDQLEIVARRGLPIVVHPDIIGVVGNWTRLGSSLVIENMDKRKPVGRTADELASLLNALPDAKLCIDLGHARQVDPSMSVATEILNRFANRITHLHVSDVNTVSQHEPLSQAAIDAFQEVADLVPKNVVVILESTFCSGDVCVDSEIDAAKEIFAGTPHIAAR